LVEVLETLRNTASITRIGLSLSLCRQLYQKVSGGFFFRKENFHSHLDDSKSSSKNKKEKTSFSGFGMHRKRKKKKKLFSERTDSED
jgi:hypothetical protein